jgi:hypothetical protein
MNASNSTYGFSHFGFMGLCEQPPSPLELYYNDMLYGEIPMYEDDAPHLDAGINYMSWSMIGLEVGDEFNLTWGVTQMSMMDMNEEDPDDITEMIFTANSEEMMTDWELNIENDTCMVLITGLLIDTDGYVIGMVWAIFNGPCEIEMGDVGLDMLSVAGDWYEIEGINGTDTLGMLMFTDSDEDEMNVLMSALEDDGHELETGDYTMRWAFEDLEAGKEYIVFMEDLLFQDDNYDYYYYDNCSEEYDPSEFSTSHTQKCSSSSSSYSSEQLS